MTVLKKVTTVGLALLGSTLVLSAAQLNKAADNKDAPKKAICVLSPTKDSKVSGIVTRSDMLSYLMGR